MPRRLDFDLEAELEAVAQEMERELESPGSAGSGGDARLQRVLSSASAGVNAGAGESFYTRVQPVPHLPGHEEGHEVLTRNAAGGLVSGPDLQALLLGVIRPDRGGASYWNFPRAALHVSDPALQRAHSLRRTAGTTLAAALAEIREYLTHLHRLAMGASTHSEALMWVGEAMHLIQDSYSGAHVERSLGTGPGGLSPIRYIRHFNLPLTFWNRTQGPHEHNAPSDDRDSVWAAPGVLRPEANHAVAASREYLTMVLRHLASPAAPANAGELSSFLDRHFVT